MYFLSSVPFFLIYSNFLRKALPRSGEAKNNLWLTFLLLLIALCGFAAAVICRNNFFAQLSVAVIYFSVETRIAQKEDNLHSVHT